MALAHRSHPVGVWRPRLGYPLGHEVRQGTSTAMRFGEQLPILSDRPVSPDPFLGAQVAVLLLSLAHRSKPLLDTDRPFCSREA